MRSGAIRRTTTETDIAVELSLDDAQSRSISTGSAMFDHLLLAFAFHARIGCRIEARSLDGIRHHLVEDTAIALGQALDAALGERRGIVRYGERTIPMDDALVRAVVDLGGRAWSRTALDLRCERIEDLESVFVPHFFASLAQHARMTLHIDRFAGDDPHHVVEAAFKALARACALAWALDPNADPIASTKGCF
ncbi:MAG: imidazoleglycerol-phosphate dehydratase [bacterium]|nr:imidazoleglycerol-phosphate dehydratase [bacterium]